jgi:hypothetical protein
MFQHKLDMLEIFGVLRWGTLRTKCGVTTAVLSELDGTSDNQNAVLYELDNTSD